MLKPQRVVCMTAETVEIAFRVGAGDRVAGVTGYAVRPPEARQKPKVAAFQTAHVDRILELNPDLVLGFSDLQADIAAELIRRGANVLITNQRTLEDVRLAMQTVANALGEPERGEALVAEFDAGLERYGRSPQHRPRVYFEEWDEPRIAGISWVSELIERCGGEDVFADLRGAGDAGSRIVDDARIIERDPEVVVASWCGKKARLERIAARPGWEQVPAVREGRLHEIKAPDILQPGPSLIEGARLLSELLAPAETTR